MGLDQLNLFDWDEINFAEITREMALSGNYLQPTVNYLPFHEKPPLFAWLQLASFQCWGAGSLGARFPNLVCGLLTLLTVYLAGRRFGGESFGRWWAFFFAASLLPSLYFRSGIIDPWFNLFIFGAVWLVVEAPRRGRLLAAGTLLGLAVLTKGPVAVLVIGLVGLVSILIGRGRRHQTFSEYLRLGLLALPIPLLWLFFLWRLDDGFFAREFLDYQLRLLLREDAGHGGFPGYHFVVLLLGCFPASLFALKTLWRRKNFATPQDRTLRILFWTVLLLFTLVNTKIVHYSSLCYFPLTWFAARGVRAGACVPALKPLLITVLSLFSLVALALPTLGQFIPWLVATADDPELTARLLLPVNWPWFTFLPALLPLAGLLLIWRTPREYTNRIAAVALLSTYLFTITASALFMPRIQAYTQGATTAFYQAHSGEDAYFGTAYHKSYAHWFYGNLPPERGAKERQWRFHGPTDRPLYFSSPLRHTERVLSEVPDAELLYQKGGFSFYRRPPAE